MNWREFVDDHIARVRDVAAARGCAEKVEVFYTTSTDYYGPYHIRQYCRGWFLHHAPEIRVIVDCDESEVKEWHARFRRAFDVFAHKPIAHSVIPKSVYDRYRAWEREPRHDKRRSSHDFCFRCCTCACACEFKDGPWGWAELKTPKDFKRPAS